MKSTRQPLQRVQSLPVVNGMATILSCGLILLAFLEGCASTGQHTELAPAATGDEIVAVAGTGTDDADLATFRDYDTIKRTLHLYIDNAGPSNGAGMRSAFFDHARIVGSVGGNFYNVTADQFKDIITADGKWKTSGKVYDSHSKS